MDYVAKCIGFSLPLATDNPSEVATGDACGFYAARVRCLVIDQIDCVWWNLPLDDHTQTVSVW